MAANAKTIREWLSFVFSVVAAIAAVVIWFFSQLGDIEEHIADHYVPKDVYNLKIQSLEDKVATLTSAAVPKSDLKVLSLQIGTLQRDFDSYTRKEAESWTVVRKNSKEIRDMVTNIQLTLARLTQ